MGVATTVPLNPSPSCPSPPAIEGVVHGPVPILSILPDNVYKANRDKKILVTLKDDATTRLPSNDPITRADTARDEALRYGLCRSPVLI
ncbi:hypothetical protein PoB_004474700 [Plakobranchus ocellatus]|uniref:Uncharacterized protein n=1 Tax=Plakobranchus ocellatus TaxID=259542 RepID=A0AAV4BGZ4_9GAST|nr:hypothetical protein PoB_004474700 [Plakobranchus ocellatus]